jgi:proteasome alpha subunit
MTMPFYASAEQIMRDRSEYARKGIARGRGVVVLSYDGGILFVAENPSKSLHKVGEIYDRIGFAAVGRYSEYENLRVAGVRIADTRGYLYDRQDVTGRALANAYAQALNAIFTESQKPFEVELCVAEVGETSEEDQLYRLTFDGSVVDEPGYVAMGGQSDTITTQVTGAYHPDLSLNDALRLAVKALGSVGGENGRPRELAAGQLEVAVLDRARPKRKFRRIVGAALVGLLPAGQPPGSATPAEPEPAAEPPAEPPAGGPAAPAGGDVEADILADVDAALEESEGGAPPAGDTAPEGAEDERDGETQA